MLSTLVAPAGRRDAPTLRAFATTCLFAALVALFAAHVLQAANGARFLRALKSNLDCLLLTALAYAVFVARYARIKASAARIVFAVYGAACLILVVVNEMLPYGLQYERFDGITHLRLPWHETIAQGAGRGGPLAYVAVLVVIGVVPYAAVVLLRLHRRTRDRSALWMLAALGVLTPFAIEGALVRLSMLHGFAAGPIGILVVVAVTGATLTQETKRRLLDSAEYFRVLFERSPFAMAVVEPGTGRILETNSVAVELSGYTARELAGRTLTDLAVPEDRPEARRGIADLSFGRIDQQQVSEQRLVHKDGRILITRFAASTLKDGAGKVLRLIVCFSDITERKQAEERIRHLAFFDQLTLLPNRELLQDRINQALSNSARSGRYGALLLLNLDNFKSINDTLGPAAGNALLQQVAARLATGVSAGDTLARGDGDEFGVLLEDLAAQPLAAAAQAKALGLKLMQALAGSYALPDSTGHVSCSVGASILSGQRQTTQDLIKQANIALHQAKKSGRNTLRFFDPRMQESVSARAALEGELRNAIAASQFTLYYQVQVDESGRELGAEALLRWRHAERGLVSPGEFISLAEETHLIVPIGEWVMDAACARLAAWSRQARTRELSLAVNVSSLQFQQADFAVHVLGCIRRHGIDPRKLKLELTETLLQGDLERTVGTMNLLKAEGVQFALDDFGTGYSSLQYLKRLPLDQLKIDRSFVHDIASDPNDRAIVSTIVAIAGHLALDVMAEGVETNEQLEVLRECGCTRYQGFLFGRPQAADRLFATEDALAS
jgi:diguanylate cyclase (GGDEF)-like protein/PAS domain S-box-containing protein